MQIPFTAIILVADWLFTQEEFNSLLSLVSPDKQERIRQFRSANDARNCLLGDITARMLICRRTGCKNTQLVFTNNEHGKPEVSIAASTVNTAISAQPGSSAVSFNISHSGCCAAAVIDDAPVGIDIERIKPYNEKIAERFFSPDEAVYVSAPQNEKERTHRFFEIWTKKEALIKKEGKGLSMPLTSFDVIGPGIAALQDTFFHNIYDDNDTICNVCSQKRDAPAVRIINSRDELLRECYALLR